MLYKMNEITVIHFEIYEGILKYHDLFKIIRIKNSHAVLSYKILY